MEEIIAKFHPKHVVVFVEDSTREFRYAHCVLCGNSGQPQFYHCVICEIFFHKECVTSLILSNLAIDHPKTHEHTLNFIRRMNSVICDACGNSSEGKMNMYTCGPCDFFVHKECISLPRAIKITRHPHRLFHTFCIRDGNMRCEVCRDDVRVGYGGYTCIEKACGYTLHSNCATLSTVWDGKDVEGEPEEESNSRVGDLASSFVEIDGRTIRHVSHHHNLILGEDEEESGKLCEACILPIEFGGFFCCKQCEYALHDTCARLPRKMENPVHRHPLTLDVETDMKEGFFTCSVCDRESCGFMYRCCQEGCGFRVDAKCASYVEPFRHAAYKYSLYLKQGRDDQELFTCTACKQYSKTVAFDGFFTAHFDFRCLTLPGLVRYKYDAHPLTLDYHIDYAFSRVLWCEICEELLKSSEFAYMCDACGTTVHVDCIFGKHPFLKPGHLVKLNGLEIHIASNTRVHRPVCHICQSLCQDKLVFINTRSGLYICSIKCINSITTIIGDLIST